MNMDAILVETDKDGTLIRRFADGNIQRSIDKALAALPPEKHVAAVAYVDAQGANIAIVGRMHSSFDWTIVANRTWNGRVGWEAAVRWSI